MKFSCTVKLVNQLIYFFRSIKAVASLVKTKMQTVANRVAMAMEKISAQRRHPNPETCLQLHRGENEALALLIYIVVTEDEFKITCIANGKINYY